VLGGIFPIFSSLWFDNLLPVLLLLRCAPLVAAPKKAKALGQTRAVKLRSDWEDIKEVIMFRACLAKFTQHKDLQKLLLDTGDKKLVEVSDAKPDPHNLDF
tara:strand:+ start:198 stop:500 length:303 start_codon:yes stop_codon:yes gene_type:complete